MSILDYFTEKGRESRAQKRIDSIVKKYRSTTDCFKQGRYAEKLLAIGSESAVDAVLRLAEQDLRSGDDISLIMSALKDRPTPKALPILRRAFDSYSRKLKAKIPADVKRAYERGDGRASLEFMRFAAPLSKYMGLAESAAEAIEACGGKAPAVPKPDLSA